MKNLKFLIIPTLLSLLFLFHHFPVPEKKQTFDIRVNPINIKTGVKLSLLSQIGLTSQQRQLIKQKQALFRRRNVELESAIGVKKADLENELDNENPNMDRIESLCKQIGHLYGKKLKIKISHQLAIEKKILTPEQVALLDDYREEEKLQPVNLAFSK